MNATSYLLLFALLSALRDVWLKSLFNSGVSNTFATLASFAATLAVFAAQSARNRLPLLRIARAHLLALGALNVLTLIAFLTAFRSIGLVDEFTSSIVDYGGSPVATTCLAVIFQRERVSVGTVVGLLLSVLGIVCLALAMAGEHPAAASTTMLGMLLALTSSIALAANNIFNKRLVDTGVSRSAILSLRMVVPTLVLLAWLTHQGRAALPGASQFVLVTLWALAGVSLPLYLLVAALDKMRVNRVALYLFLIPVFTYFGALFAGRHFQRAAGSVGIGLIVGGVIIGERLRARATPRSVAPAN